MAETIYYDARALGSYAAAQLLYNTGNPYMPYDVTPHFVEVGQTLVIEVDQADNLSIRIGAPASAHPPKEYELTAGTNYINVENSGQLFISNQSWDINSTLSITLPDGVRQVPTYYKDQTDLDEFKAEVAANPDLPIHIIGDYATIILRPYSLGPEFFNDLDRTLHWHDDSLMAEHNLSGYRDTEYGNSSDSFMFEHTTYFMEASAGFMWTVGAGYSGYNGIGEYDRYVLKRLLDPDQSDPAATGMGWGPWHENGHMHQMGEWALSRMGELVPNIWSEHARTMVNGTGYRDFSANNTGADAIFEANPDATTFQDLSFGERYIIYQHLYVAFGEDFYANVAHYYRTLSKAEFSAETNGMIKDDAEKGSLFARVASKITGYDLTSFFDTWKWPVLDDDRAAIAAMNLKDMPYDLANLELSQLAGLSYEDLPRITDVEFPDVPHAETVNGFAVVAGQPAPDLSQYVFGDSSVVSIEYLNPERAANAYNVRLGPVMYEVLIKDAEGNRNVVILNGYVVPADYQTGSSQEIYQRALADFQAGNVNTYFKHYKLLAFSNEDGAAELLADIKNATMEGNLAATAFFDIKNPRHFELVDAANGIFEFRMDADMYDAVVANAQARSALVNVNLLIHDPAIEKDVPVLRVSNGNVSFALNVQRDGTDYVYTLQAPVALDDPDIKIKMIFHAPRVGDVDISGANIKISDLFGSVADEALTSAEIGRLINGKNIIEEDNGFSLTVPLSHYHEMASEGQFTVRALVNGVEIGTVQVDSVTGATASTGILQLRQEGANYKFAVVWNNIDGDDQIKFQIDWQSDISTDASGVVDVEVTGTWFGRVPADNAIRGTNGADQLDGGSADDTIYGLNGNDRLKGDDGNDRLEGGNGRDRLWGHAGNDLLMGGDANDRLHGGVGDDILRGGEGTDYLIGDLGHDAMYGGDGSDLFYAGGGNDLLEGENGNDRLYAGIGNDRVYGGAGKDLLEGEDGDDWVYGGDGNDTMNGGAGEDRMFGGEGADKLRGGDGNDAIYGGLGNDQLNGNIGDDLLMGGKGNDILRGQAGSDVMRGGYGNDTIYATPDDVFVIDNTAVDMGGEGYDTLIAASNASFTISDLGQHGIEAFIGSGGVDTIIGAGATDYTLNGNGGDDRLTGGAGDDVIRGGAGSDVMRGRDGRDTIYADGNDVFVFNGQAVDMGGTGYDTLVMTGAAAFNTNDLQAYGFEAFVGTNQTDTVRGTGNIDYRLTGNGGNDRLFGSNGNDRLDGGNDNDQLYGGGGADVLIGGGGHDAMYGDDGNDQFYGGAGRDRLFGGNGNDRLDGGNDNDQLYGGRDADVLMGGGGDDVMLGDDGNDRLYGGAGRDRLNGGNDNDQLYGGRDADVLMGGGGDDVMLGDDGNDRFYGGGGNDQLEGGTGSDQLYAGQGNDILRGGDGNDTLRGESGNDQLYGDQGNDLLVGGGGADTFYFTNGFGTDRIADFNIGQAGEKISLRGVSSITNFGDLADNHMSQSGTNVVINAGNGDVLYLNGVTIASLTADDFIF